MDDSSLTSSTVSNASDTPYIDYDSVIHIYRDIQDIASRLSIIREKISAASEFCDKTSFYVQGFSYEDNFSNCCDAFTYSISNIEDYADALLKALNTALHNNSVGIIDDPIQPEVTTDE